MPDLSCQHMHFAVNQKTDSQTMEDYLRWFAALNLLQDAEKAAVMGGFQPGGPSTCLLRTHFDDAACSALFFDGNGALRPENDYWEMGRQALRALLDRHDEIDRFRIGVLDDATWPEARRMGASPELRELIPLQSTDTRFTMVLQDVTGDVYDIVWWATAMTRAGAELQAMRAFLGNREAVSLGNDPEFARRREKLQRLMLDVVNKSKVRFHEPWGMVSLFWTAGSRESSGTITAGNLVVQRKRPAAP
jgi:hypothetical protein